MIAIGDLVARLRLDNSDLKKNVREAETSLGKLQKTAVRALSGWVSVRGAQAFWNTLLDSVEAYRMAVIQTAAFTTGMMEKQAGQSIADRYKEAKDYAEGLVTTLEKLDAQTVLTGNDLQLINRELMKQGILLDTNNEKQKEAFVTLSNAVAVISAGAPNKQIQLMQETRALLQGQVNQYSQLAMMLDAQVGGLSEQVKLHKQQGDLIEWIGGLLEGFNAATGDIEMTWEAIGTSMATLTRQTIRGGLTPAYQDILNIMNDMLIWGREHKDQIQIGLLGAWNTLKTSLKSIKGLYDDIASSFQTQNEYMKTFIDGWNFILNFAIPIGLKAIGGGFKLLISYYDEAIRYFEIRFGEYVNAVSKWIGYLGDKFIEMFKNAQTNFLSFKNLITGKISFDDFFKGYKATIADKTVADFLDFSKLQFKPNYSLDQYLNDLDKKIKEARESYLNIGRIEPVATQGGGGTPRVSTIQTTEEAKNLRNSLLNIARQKEAYASLISDVKGMYAAKTEALRAQLNIELSDTNKTEAEKAAITKRYLEEIRQSTAMAQQQWSSGFAKGFREYAASVGNVVQNVSGLVTNAFKGMEDALVEMVRTGKLEFSKLADSIISDLARIVIQSQITGPLASMLFGAMGQATFYGGGVYTPANVAVPVAHNGWNVGMGGTTTRSVNPGLFMGAPKLHDGLMSDEFPAILQKGERVLSKADVGRANRNEGITVNIQEAPGTKATAQQRSDGSLDIIIEQITNNLASGIASGRSSLANAMESQYGLRRSYGARR